MERQERKSVVRDDARRRRAALTSRTELSAQIWENLCDVPEFLAARRIFAYASTSTEVETLPFLTELAASGKIIVLSRTSENELHFFEIENLLSLELGAFGILEPDQATQLGRPAIIPEAGDFVLVPGVAFTKTGVRLGHGAGFYDRFLGRVPAHVPKAGLAFSVQLYPSLPEEEFDIRVDYLVTELECIRCADVKAVEPGPAIA